MKFLKFRFLILLLALSQVSLAQSPLDSFASAFKFRSLGPAFMSGRIADIAIHPEKENTWYLGLGSGGVWKTENAGTTWEPIFDNQDVYSVGCITIDPTNPHSIWVGSGENVGGRHVGFGDGIYHSSDDGKSWENMGLKNSEHISKIIVHPTNPDVVWVAVQGPLWTKGGERGLYKTTDGGKTWKATLEINEWTGVTDLVIDPRNPDRLYCASWQRHRTVAAYLGGGPGTGLYRSEDGGDTWEKLSKGLPNSNMGKIGLAISPMQPDVLYAAIELDRRTGAVYRSEDRGASWVKMSPTVSGATGPHYYQELYASPHQFDKIYLANVRMLVSEDGGKTFNQMNEKEKHSDNHAVAWKKDDADYLMVGCDGGLYESFDGEKNWKYHANLPTVQYYKLAVDDSKPFYNVYAGTQDNNTHGGPTRTDNVHGIRNADWFITLGGDGHQPATEPGNPDIVYSQWQQGNLSRIDRKNGETVLIQPQPKDGDPYERYNWDAPILVSPHKATRLYFASQRLWKSENRGDKWRPISGDLTRNEERITLDIMGGPQSWDNPWDYYAMSNYNSITSLSESPIDSAVIYVGTDDGLIQITEDGGENWRRIEVSSLPDCPNRAFVNDIKADLFDAKTVYVALDNHKYGDYQPFLYKSTNLGKSWTRIKGNLPDKLLVWRIVQDHKAKNLFFLATEFGIYTSIDAGKYWTKLKSGLPTIPFRDLVIQKEHSDLVGASFGRGIYVLDDYSSLREMSESTWAKDAVVFPSREAFWYNEKKVLGWGKRASQGASYFVADNPPFGATFTYYLKEGYSTAKADRTKQEKELEKAGKDYKFPGWSALEEERKELKSEVYLVISNNDGKVIRYLPASSKKGIHKLTWDLRYPGTNAFSNDGGGAGRGFLCEPGSYNAHLMARTSGTLLPISEKQSFNVRRINAGSLEGATIDEVTSFWRSIEDANKRISASRLVMRTAQAKINTMEKLLDNTPEAPKELHEKWQQLRKEVLDLDQELNGMMSKKEVGQKTDPTISSRMGSIYAGVSNSSYGPTQMHKEQFAIAIKLLEQFETTLSAIVNERIPELDRAFKEANSPYIEGMDYEPGK